MTKHDETPSKPRRPSDIVFDKPEFYHYNGVFCLQEGDKEGAFSWFEKLAKLGDAMGMRCMANMYLQGFRPRAGVPIKEAVRRVPSERFDEVLDNGVVLRGHNFALLHELAREAPDWETAWEWYMKAAELGDAVSMMNAGIMAFDGDGCPKDIAVAKQLLGDAARQGYPHAQKAYQDRFGDLE